MKSICKIKVKGKECELEFQVKKSNLFSCSCYFHNIINILKDQGQEPTDFTFSNQEFDENEYNLYFSEFPSKNIAQYQINSQIDEVILQHLLKLDKILQSDHIKKKIYEILEEKQSITSLIYKYSKNPVEKRN